MNGLNAYYVPGAITKHYVPQSSFEPDWVMMRAYKSFIMKGMSFRKGSKVPLPLRVLRKWLELGIARVLSTYHYWRGNRARAFEQQVRCARIRGLLQGLTSKDALL
jgi:hypothetical protein